MSIKYKRPSPGKFKTLKSHGDILNKLNFNIEYGDNDITISSKQSPIYANEYTINIKKRNNKTNCVNLFYDKSQKTIELADLLFGLSKDNKCRDNTSGSYYIDLIFNLVKILYNTAPSFKPVYFELIDKSSFDKFNIIPVAKDKPISLSTYKLLTELRTYYEGYGFIPILVDNKFTFKFDYGKLDKLLQNRNTILLSPISKLELLINEILKSTKGKHHLYRYFTIPKYSEEGEDMPEPEIINDEIATEFKKLYEMVKTTDYNNNSMSEIFIQFVNNPIPELTEICNQIYLIVYYYINIILEFMDNDNNNYSFTYIITDDHTHYTKIDDIYRANNIHRYSDYAEFLYSGAMIERNAAINNIASGIGKLTLHTNSGIKQQLAANLLNFNLTPPSGKNQGSPSANLAKLTPNKKPKSTNKNMKHRPSNAASF